MYPSGLVPTSSNILDAYFSKDLLVDDVPGGNLPAPPAWFACPKGTYQTGW